MGEAEGAVPRVDAGEAEGATAGFDAGDAAPSPFESPVSNRDLSGSSAILIPVANMCVVQVAPAYRRTKADRRVWAKGSPANQLPTRTRLMAAAISKC